MDIDLGDMELYDMFIDLSFFRLCKMYMDLKRLRSQKKKRRVRRWYINPINRVSKSDAFYRKDFANMKNMDDNQFFLHTRMSRPIFQLLLNLIKYSLQKSRQKIFAEERLAITLEYLAHGTPIQTIAYSRKLGKSTVRNIILETCDVLWSVLSPKYASEPSTDEYAIIEDDFNRMFNFPNCIGAVDSKQVSMRSPLNTENKVVNSIVLSAACNASYIFTAVSVTCHGKESTRNKDPLCLSPFGEESMLDEIPLPPSKPLSATSSESFPHYFVANCAFELKSNIIWPYSTPNNDRNKIAFNKRLSPVCRVAENSYGILSARWKILLTTIDYLPENAESIVLACFALHNFIMMNDHERCYCPYNCVDTVEPDGTVQEGEWRNEIKSYGYQPLQSAAQHDRTSSEKNKQLREKLAEYFLNEEQPQ